MLLPAGSRPRLGSDRPTEPAGAAQAELAPGRGHGRSRPLAGRGGSGPAVTWAPSSRPAGHRQSVAEQEPRAQPARAWPSARRRPRWLGLREAADSERAITATATATVLRAARSRSGAALRRAQRRIPARIWARRTRPPLPLLATPDSKRGPAGGQEDPEQGPHAREPRDFGLVQLLPLWGLLFRCCRVYTGSLQLRLAYPSASRVYRPPPPRGGPACTQNHEDTWDLPGDFGWTFANCHRGDVFR